MSKEYIVEEKKFNPLLQSLYDKENTTKEEMITVINEINNIANININGYSKNWLKDSIELIHRFDTNNKIVEECFKDINSFPYYVTFDNNENNSVFIKSKCVAEIEGKRGLIYDEGCTPNDIIVTKENFYYGHFRKKSSKENLKISNELDYIKQFFKIAKNYYQELKVN